MKHNFVMYNDVYSSYKKDDIKRMMKKVDFKPDSVPETNSSPLKMDGWNTILSYWDGPFSGAICC